MNRHLEKLQSRPVGSARSSMWFLSLIVFIILLAGLAAVGAGLWMLEVAGRRIGKTKDSSKQLKEGKEAAHISLFGAVACICSGVAISFVSMETPVFWLSSMGVAFVTGIIAGIVRTRKWKKDNPVRMRRRSRKQ